MALLPKIRPLTPAWHKARAQGIGASESPALFSIEHPGYAVSAYSLRLIKRGQIKAESVFVGSDELARLGLIKEPVVAKIIADRRGLKIRRGSYVVDDIEPRMRCSTDYIVDEPNDWVRKAIGRKVAGPGVMQIKTVILPQFIRHWTDSTAPDYVRIQLQQEMACLGFQWGMIGAEVGGFEYREFPVVPSRHFAAHLRHRIGMFWKNSVEGDEIPPIDASESTRLAIRTMHPPKEFRPGMADYEQDDELDAAAAELDSASARLKAAKMDVSRSKNVINARLEGCRDAMTAHWWIDRDARGTISVKPRMTNG